MSHSDAWEYNRTCDVCWRRLTTLDDMCETCEDNISLSDYYELDVEEGCE